MYNFEKLTVWKKSMDFCEALYKATKLFPKEEMFGLTSQLRRAATSIPLNISEGSGCGSKREFKHFLTIALRSQYEAVTTIKLCKRLNYLTEANSEKLGTDLDEVGKLLHGLIRSMSSDN